MERSSKAGKTRIYSACSNNWGWSLHGAKPVKHEKALVGVRYRIALCRTSIRCTGALALSCFTRASYAELDSGTTQSAHDPLFGYQKHLSSPQAVHTQHPERN